MDIHEEDIRIKGFTILKGVLDSEKVEVIRDLMDGCYAKQELEFGKEALIEINELDLLRAPLQYDERFIDLIRGNRILYLVTKILGEVFSLHLQNGVINRPDRPHHQSSWHRDLPYQEFTSSKPLALSVFYCIDKFTPETGSTLVLPYSHKETGFPSNDFVEAHELQILAEAGDVLVFDSMVYHRAGYNSSDIIRRGINNVFVVPIIKQQIDLPLLLDGQYAEDPLLSMLLGYQYQVPASVNEYRSKKQK